MNRLNFFMYGCSSEGTFIGPFIRLPEEHNWSCWECERIVEGTMGLVENALVRWEHEGPCEKLAGSTMGLVGCTMGLVGCTMGVVWNTIGMHGFASRTVFWTRVRPPPTELAYWSEATLQRRHRTHCPPLKMATEQLNGTQTSVIIIVFLQIYNVRVFICCSVVFSNSENLGSNLKQIGTQWDTQRAMRLIGAQWT